MDNTCCGLEEKGQFSLFIHSLVIDCFLCATNSRCLGMTQGIKCTLKSLHYSKGIKTSTLINVYTFINLYSRRREKTGIVSKYIVVSDGVKCYGEK